MTQSRSVTRSDMAASLPNEPDDLLITDELHHRIAHKADYQREKLAIQDLARQMASPIRFCYGSSILRWSSVEGSPQG
jgi:hypothetical protein